MRRDIGRAENRGLYYMALGVGLLGVFDVVNQKMVGATTLAVSGSMSR